MYVALGTEGILAGPAPGSGSTRPWELRQNIPSLRPLALNFSDPLTVAGVVLAALLLPPLPYLHAHFLSRVWRRFMPAAEAWRRALDLSIGFGLLSAAAILLWIIPDTFDIGFYPLAIGVSIVVVLVSTFLTIRHARRASLDTKVTRFTTARAIIASMIVPLGVLSVWWLWGIILIMVSAGMAEDWRPKVVRLDPINGIIGAFGAIVVGILLAISLLWAQWVVAGFFVGSMTGYP